MRGLGATWLSVGAVLALSACAERPPGPAKTVPLAAGAIPATAGAAYDLMRADLAAFSGARFAYNEALSQSGWAAPLAWFQERRLRLTPTLLSEAHEKSARAVAEGEADFAAIDAVTWRLLCRHTDLGQRLRALGTTSATPGLPYIAAKGADAEATFQAVAQAIAALSASDRDTLMIEGIVRIPAQDYLSVPIPQAPNHSAHSD